MPFSDYDIKSGNFTNKSLYVSFKVCGNIDGETCGVELYIDRLYPKEPIINYSIDDYSCFNMYIKRFDGSYVHNPRIKDICDSLNMPYSMISEGGNSLSKLTDIQCCLIFDYLKCNKATNKLSSNKAIDITGPCVKCGCVDKYNSPCPNFNNEIRCYNHWM